jgi:hypothetical protein
MGRQRQANSIFSSNGGGIHCRGKSCEALRPLPPLAPVLSTPKGTTRKLSLQRRTASLTINLETLGSGERTTLFRERCGPEVEGFHTPQKRENASAYLRTPWPITRPHRFSIYRASHKFQKCARFEGGGYRPCSSRASSGAGGCSIPAWNSWRGAG